MTGNLVARLRESVCLYCSFDESLNADRSRGESRAIVNESVTKHLPSGGRFGGAVEFHARDHGWAEDELRYAARDNFPYSESGFDGTIAMWLCGDPDADLSPEYPVDPFHISRHAADASFYLDLTRPNDWRYGSPRKLRFGFYNDSPKQDMFVGGQLIVAGELGWNDRQWHHVVGTWQNANSGALDGFAALYIDGQLRGTMEGYEHRLAWDINSLSISLGQRYVGRMDELLVCSAALSADEVAHLYGAGESLAASLLG